MSPWFDGVNSTLRDWVFYNLSQPVWQLSPCQTVDATTGSISYISCSQICNNSEALFDSSVQTSNLQTCGVWTTLLSAYSCMAPNRELSLANNGSIASTRKAYDALGLDQEVYEYASSYANTIGTGHSFIYFDVLGYPYSDDGKIAGPYTGTRLFEPSIRASVSSQASFRSQDSSFPQHKYQPVPKLRKQAFLSPPLLTHQS